jgi:hypothetical protein
MPEKFTCNINVDKQWAYSVDFKGTLVYIPALGEIPIVDSGGLKIERKVLFFGPYVVKKTYKTFPAEDTVVIIRNGGNG